MSRSSSRRVGLALLVAAVTATTTAVAHADVPRLSEQTVGAAAPDAGSMQAHYRQYTGERILGLSDEPACTVVMTKNYPMANTAYGPDEPFRGPFSRGDCTGTYTRIVAHVHTDVTGVQFDRIGWVNLGNARIVTLSSQEPRGNGAGKVVQDETYDVTRYASLFTDDQPVEFTVANVVTGQYNGIFYSDLSFEFYDDATPLPDPAPDVVTGLPASTILADPVTQTFSVPANTTALAAELYVKGSGGCDEFWWAAAPAPYPGQCDAFPILEIGVSIDGQPAALVNTYPVVFTGANGPTWWHPIPAPRAYDLRPYTVDLAPFIGTLTDGAEHTITYSISRRRWVDGNDVTVWSNLLVTENPESEARTTGEISRISARGVIVKDEGDAGSYQMAWRHRRVVSGTLYPAGGIRSLVTTAFRSRAHTLGDAATNDNHYAWATRTEDNKDPDALRRDKARYGLTYRSDGWEIRDRDRRTVGDGPTARHERLRDTMHSETASGTPVNRRSTERWSLVTDGPLGCGSTYLVGENPDLVKRRLSDEC